MFARNDRRAPALPSASSDPSVPRPRETAEIRAPGLGPGAGGVPTQVPKFARAAGGKATWCSPLFTRDAAVCFVRRSKAHAACSGRKLVSIRHTRLVAAGTGQGAAAGRQVPLGGFGAQSRVQWRCFLTLQHACKDTSCQGYAWLPGRHASFDPATAVRALRVAPLAARQTRVRMGLCVSKDGFASCDKRLGP